ncbi:MAG: RNA 2',3'-cyclic phosphodiesterase [Lentisphaeria bacterium]|nr:RNA 2',3'-cyclic phosphodiesterase [Lentisphaeria bacterium]
MKKTNEPQRLFVALSVPSELGRAIVQYEKELPFWRWYGAKELHLTMRFIGDTPADKIDALVEEFEQGFANQRMVRFTTLGYGFNPSERKAQSLHLRMQCSHAMEELKEKVDAVVQKVLGLPPEARKFQAHITLARFKRPPLYLDFKRLKDWAENIPKLPEPFAPEITLFRSELTKHGAVHTPLARHELDRPI